MREFAIHLPVLAGAILTWAAPAAASPVAEALATCRPFVTVQCEGCEVETHARCPNGDTFWREDSSDGIPVFARSKPDGGVVFDHDAQGDGVLRVLESRDSQSMRELLETGLDSFDMTVEFRLLFPFPQQSLFRGWFRLDDEEVVIDGRKLRTAVSEQWLEIGSGDQMALGTGMYHLDDKLGLLLEGPFEVSFAGAKVAMGSLPASFIFPGEPGFASEVPAFGCGPALSSLPQGASRG